MMALNSLAVWGSLAAAGVALPVVIHLLNRARPKRVPWAAMELLLASASKRSRRVKTEDLLLMLLRCLALLLLALAMMRLVLPGLGGGLSAAPREAVIGLDTSYSMGHGQFEPRIALARQRVQQIVADLPAGSKVSLVTLDPEPAVLLRHADPDPDLVARRLETVDVQPTPLALRDGLAAMKRLADGSGLANRAAWLITDAQPRDWDAPDAETRRALAALHDAAATTLVPVSDGTAANLGIADLRVASGVRRAGGFLGLTATVTNHGPEPASTTATLRRDGEPADVVAVGPVAPGQAEVVRFGLRLGEAGQARFEAALDEDPLPTDNRAYAVVNVMPSLAVLLVDGDPSPASPSRSAAFPLELATRLERSGYAQGLETRTVRVFDLREDDLDRAQVVVLADVGELSAFIARRLAERVVGGAGLIVYAGGRSGPLLTRGPLGDVLPATFAAAVPPDLDVRANVQVPPSGHPLAEELARLEADFAEVVVAGHHRVAPRPEARTLLTLTTGEPLLVIGEHGRGVAALVATGPGRAWSSLPLSATGPALFHLLLNHVAPGRAAGPVRVGDRVEVRVEAAAVGPDAKVATPGGEAAAPRRVDHDDDDLLTLAHDRADRPGFYGFELRKGAPPVSVAANVDPGEGAVASMPADRLAASIAAAGLPLAVGLDRGDGAGWTADIALWRWLAMAALALLVTQAALSAWFTRRKRAVRSEIRTGYGVGVGGAA